MLKPPQLSITRWNSASFVHLVWMAGGSEFDTESEEMEIDFFSYQYELHGHTATEEEEAERKRVAEIETSLQHR